MTLQTDLSDRLDVGSLVTTLAGAAGGSRTRLENLTLPAPPERLAEVSGGVRLDASGIAALASRLAADIAPQLASLSDETSALAPITAPLELIEAATTQDLPAKIRELIAKLAAELEQPGDSGFAGVLSRLAETVSSAPEGQALWQVLSSWLAAGGLDTRTLQLPIGDFIAAVQAGVQAVGGLMSLESVLAEAERLTAILATQLDPLALNARTAEVLAALEPGGPLLSTVAALDADDPAQVEAAAGAIFQVSSRLNETLAAMSEAMGFGEATLVYLDLPRVRVDVERSTALVRTADTAAITRAFAWLGERLGALLDVDLGAVAERTFDQILDELEARSAELAATIESAPVEQLAEPIRAGVATFQEMSAKLTEAIASVTLAVRTALEQVRAAVAALPLDTVADTVRTALQPVTDALDTLRALVADVEAALGDAANEALEAIQNAEEAVDTFTGAVQQVFHAASEFVDGLGLDAAAGQLAGNIQGFADLLAQADLQPTFDGVSSAIETTASVIEQVPFELLPDSMEGEVVAALRPVREAQPREVQAQVLLVFRGPSGESLEELLRSQVEGVQQLFDQLLETIQQLDPRTQAAALDDELESLAAKVREVSPQVALEPVTEAIDSLKAAVASLDLDAQLQPLRDAFAQILAAIDRYSPGALVQPLEQRLDEAREKLIADLKLRDLAPALDELVERGKRLLDFLDPEQVEEQIRRAFEEIRELVADLPLEPAGGLGAVVASFLAGTGLPIQSSSFDVVVRWLRGDAAGSTELTGRAGRMSGSVERTRNAVSAVDPAHLTASLASRVVALRRAMEALPADARARLTAAVDSLLPQETLARIAANRDRYLAVLGTAAAAAEMLRRTGLSEADAVVIRLRASIDPVRALTAFFRSLLARTGVPGVEGGLAGIAQAVVDAAPPERIAALAAPLLRALQGRIAALLDALAAPLKDGIAEILRVIESFDLTPLREALDGVQQEVRGQIEALSPDQLLGDVLTGFRDLQAEVAGFDPLAPVIAVLNALRDTAASLLEKLDVEAILAEPIALYEEILGLLVQLDLEVLFGPVLEQLVALQGQVEEGLERTVTAFERLQESLPASVGSTSVSGNVSVGGGV
ncbi:MAG TPA: hypothetical protein VMW27_17935 [Thermoanaerobaculia bacterium]|nr:hypothetical protein [Thermoanaerobaculia bacterium]